jgi:hypothetical protein
MKSELEPKPQAQPKLNRILKKGGSYKALSIEDMPYIWAGYRTGAFDIFGDEFKGKMTKEDFIDTFSLFLDNNQLAPFVFLAKLNGELKPVGIGLFWERGRVLQTVNLIWFSWATKTSILSSYVSFINSIRKEKYLETNKNYVIIECARTKDQKFFDHVCKYGIMRRVGTSLEIYYNDKCCIYESRCVINGN